MVEETDPQTAVPLTIISGFLGAGKTTVINSLVRKSEEKSGVRTGLLVNDFAEINIDAELIRTSIENGEGGRDAALVELSNGCVCCTISGELQHSIDKVLERGVDHVIVETSGVSDPANIVQTLLHPQLRKLVWLSGLVVVVDGESLLTTLERSASARNQLKQADVVVINKTDLLSSGDYEQVKERIRQAAPSQFNIIPSQYGNIPSAVIYGLQGERHQGKDSGDGSGEAQPSDPHRLWSSLSTSGSGGHKAEVDGLSTLSYRRKQVTFNLGRFQHFMAHRFPSTVIRAKGFLHFDCSPTKRYILQLSGKRRFDAGDLEVKEGGRCHGVDFVFIGSDLDKGRVVADLDACQSDSRDGEDEDRSRELARSLSGFIRGDVRFQVGEEEKSEESSIVLFRLRHTRWHGMSLSDMNRSLLSTLNSMSAETELFFTHLTSPDDGDSFMLRFDAAMGTDKSGHDIWLWIQRATETMLTNVFMNTFCCGS